MNPWATLLHQYYTREKRMERKWPMTIVILIVEQLSLQNKTALLLYQLQNRCMSYQNIHVTSPLTLNTCKNFLCLNGCNLQVICSTSSSFKLTSYWTTLHGTINNHYKQYLIVKNIRILLSSFLHPFLYLFYDFNYGHVTKNSWPDNAINWQSPDWRNK